MSEQGWCQECNKHTQDGQLVKSKVAEYWYFFCADCKKEYL